MIISQFKLHIHFLLNKKIVLTTCILYLISGLVFLYQSNFYVGSQIIDASRESYIAYYLDSSVIFVKIICVIYSVFLMSGDFLDEMNHYVVFFIGERRSIEKFQFYKQFVLLLTIIFFVLNEYLLFHVVISIFTPLSIPFERTWYLFIAIFLESFFYGILAIFMMLMIRQMISSLIVITIFWLFEVLISSPDILNNVWIHEISSFIPLIFRRETRYFLDNNIYIYLMVLFLAYMIIFLISIKKEQRI